MNRMKVFLLLAVVIGFSACQSRNKQNTEQEMEADSPVIAAPTEEVKTLTGVVGDASMHNFMLVTSKGDTIFSVRWIRSLAKWVTLSWVIQ